LLSRHLVPLFSWITEHEVVIPSCFVVGNILYRQVHVMYRSPPLVRPL
jgi:hypothetical protein